MKTYVAEMDGRAIFAFRAFSDTSAQAWLDVHAVMRRRLEQIESGGRRIWNGHTEIIAREASADEETIWIRLRDEAVEVDANAYPDSITVWLIPNSDERRTSNGAQN
ncbi:MAG TPA: hypothetical protein VMW57_00855 [Methyloceanibacter sp.]|nr:hypothetical protein [Methyloceanibacter sp.]